MKKSALTLFSIALLLFVFTAAGCGGKKVQEDISGADSAEMVPEETMAEAETPREAPVMAEEMVDSDLARLAAEVKKLYTVHFDFDKYNIRPEDADLLRKNAVWLKANDSVKLVIEGHADERGETEYNLALGDRRANSVKGFLVSLGVKGSNLSTISYGEEMPADPGHHEAAWAKNRRAVFNIAK